MTPASATPARFRLTVYDAEPGITLPADGTVFVYAVSGALTLIGPDGDVRDLGEDDGAFAPNGARLGGNGRAWIYRLAAPDAASLEGAEIVRSELVRPTFGPASLVRADRIESPPGAATPRHGHRGPGIRRLVFGRILAEVGDTVERIDAGMAWFETGADMVVGTNIGGTNAAFVRVMVLPAELEGGKSSFMAADAAEAAKPRAVQNRLFGEVLIDG
ncbi:hypothetical protein L1787_22660 [Acuticoccus sp. M5D2P5]|uniref:hypothetical protein n=1 Tax=Acuticoccus kalidii TaxID=2910977 RepID=UPI001F3D8BA5|nr:hypothetical protein [Acuticoccus kalidii]MCF3936197.1 hypothetical protein [Acuticoccus kalidii]